MAPIGVMGPRAMGSILARVLRERRFDVTAQNRTQAFTEGHNAK
jgi:6-phosphogluconate dehydrogenase